MELAIPAARTSAPMQDLASFSAAYITVYMLAAVRVLAALMFNPLLGSARVPMMGRVGLGLFATLVLWGLNPRKWLTWYFERCAAAGGKVPEDIQPSLPWNLSQEDKKNLGEPDPTEGDDTS